MAAAVKDAFSFMAMGQRIKIRIGAAKKAERLASKALHNANKAISEAKMQLQSARMQHAAAVNAHEAAVQEVKDAQELAHSLAQKRQRLDGCVAVREETSDLAGHNDMIAGNVHIGMTREDGSTGSDNFDSGHAGDPTNAVIPNHPRVERGLPNPPNWWRFHKYTHATYQKLEVEEQDRRAIEINPDNHEIDLPWGNDQRGWFEHWRRGVGPVIRGWAKGSMGAVIHMLVEAACQFGVVDEVHAGLGRKATRQAEVCIYICERLRHSLSVLKRCNTEEQRVDYHVVLGAVAPRPEDRMAERVASVLGVGTGRAKIW